MWLQNAADVRCCHTSGMHDPTHYRGERYVCTRQVEVAGEVLMYALGFGEWVEEPHRSPRLSRPDPVDVRPEDGCGWCRRAAEGDE